MLLTCESLFPSATDWSSVLPPEDCWTSDRFPPVVTGVESYWFIVTVKTNICWVSLTFRWIGHGCWRFLWTWNVHNKIFTVRLRSTEVFISVLQHHLLVTLHMCMNSTSSSYLWKFWVKYVINESDDMWHTLCLLCTDLYTLNITWLKFDPVWDQVNFITQSLWASVSHNKL